MLSPASVIALIKRHYFLAALLVFLLVIGVFVSFFSTFYPDDYLYLYETHIMSWLLSEGAWIGSDYTGTHGFVFKIPVALGFMLFPNVLVLAKIFTVLVSLLTVIAAYFLGKKFIKENTWNFIYVLLFATSYQFLRLTPTYLRDIPSLFMLVLFFISLFKERITLFHGLLLLLLFDSKEYVGVLAVLALIPYLVYFEYVSGLDIKRFIKRCALLFLPTFFYVLLMYSTNVVPYNDSLSKVLLIRGQAPVTTKLGFNTSEVPILRHTEESAIDELVSKNNVAKYLDELVADFNQKQISLFYDYLKKISSSRGFTVTSVPWLFVIVSFALGLKRLLKKEYANIAEVYIFLFYALLLGIYILRQSHERYLVHATPAIFLYFTLALKDIVKGKNKTLYIRSGIIASFFTLFTFIFDDFIRFAKVPLGVLMFIWYFSLIKFADTSKFWWKRFIKSKTLEQVQIYSVYGFVLFYAFVVVSMQLYGLYKYSLVSQYLSFGSGFEYEKIAEFVDSDKTYWFNGEVHALKLYTKQYSSPRVDRLRYDFRKKHIVNLYTSQIYGHKPKTRHEFVQNYLENDLDYVLYVKSEIPTYSFQHQRMLDNYIKKDVLRVEDEIQLKNKKLYILTLNPRYNVVDEHVED